MNTTTEIKMLKPINQNEMTTRGFMAAAARILKANGMQRAVRPKYRMFGSPEGQRQEGFTLHRLGCSSTAAVDWYHPNDSYCPGSKTWEAARESCKKNQARCIEILQAHGVVFTNRYFIECRWA